MPGEDPDPADPARKRHICEDAFFTAAVDLDDLAAADEVGFQAVVMHFLEERHSNRSDVIDIFNNPPPADARTVSELHRVSHGGPAEGGRSSSSSSSGTRPSGRLP